MISIFSVIVMSSLFFLEGQTKPLLSNTGDERQHKDAQFIRLPVTSLPKLDRIYG